MSRLRRFIQVSLIGTVFLCFLAAWRRSAKSGAAGTIIKHPVATPANDVLQYWTADKMRHAQATNLPKTDALERGKQHPPTPRP
ncbi:hypothetical protein [Dictyobacter kobayashii]|uniref:Uncharacterized protein n=1 Tax=Dictyobacter kobayashii TaxID=2014872 RepID=A0A402ASR0_9CHLR|nr:hypothetical protein [Dictyobacter kobayashii]GCE22122.1 hypothetical protein KDK_59220 [Dictyobacter kobayashii]